MNLTTNFRHVFFVIKRHFVTETFHESSVEVSVLCQEGGRGGKLLLIGEECKIADGKQPSDWTIIQDGSSACDWTRIQDGRWKSSHLIGQ